MRTKYIVVFNSPQHGGGVEQVVAHLLQALPESARSHYKVVCSDRSLPESFGFSGVNCVNLRTRRFGIAERIARVDRLYFAYKVFRYLQLHLKNDEIVNVQGNEYSVFLKIFRKRLPSGIRLVVSVHGSYFDAYSRVVKTLPWRFFPVRLFYSAFRWYFYLWEKAGINRADQYVFITHYLQKFYRLTYGVSVNSVVIHNGIDAMGPKTRRKVSQPGQHVAIIVGSSVYAKGLDVALNAIQLLYEKGFKIKLRIVGFSDLSEKLKSLPYVEYVGRVAANDIAHEYAKADFLLFPSRNEGFPLVVLEALTGGLPVLVSAQCKFHEIPGSDRMGKVISGFDPVDWAKGIEEILSTIEIEKMTAAIKSYDFSNYRWANIADRYHQVLEGK